MTLVLRLKVNNYNSLKNIIASVSNFGGHLRRGNEGDRMPHISLEGDF